MTSWNRRVAAATRTRDTNDPEARAERLRELGLPRGLHGHDLVAVQTLLRVAETSADSFCTTILARVDDDSKERTVRIAIIGNGAGTSTFVSNVEEDELQLDPLTGLPGRDHLVERVEAGLLETTNSGHGVAVYSIDVDRFKAVNDTGGFAGGDAALRAISAELVALLRPDDVLTRLGGDEFAIVCPDVLGLAEASALGERFRAICADAPVDSPLNGLTLSIGIALGGADRGAEELVRDAETALYQAKARGRDRCEMFDEDLRNQSERRITVDQRLRAALDDDAIQVHYQPIIDIAQARLVGVEALLRIAGEDGEFLDPRVLVKAAEDSGLIRRVEESVLERAARAMTVLPDDDSDDPMFLSVNVSDRRLTDSRFPLTLARTLHAAGLPAEQLRLELSPSLLDGAATTGRLVTQLQALGVGVAIDEYQTPSQSPLMDGENMVMVKLDQSIVRAICTDQGRAHAEVVVAGLRERGVEICAVGVESQEELAAVEELGCRYAQGYYFSPPVDGSSLLELAIRTTRV